MKTRTFNPFIILIIGVIIYNLRSFFPNSHHENMLKYKTEMHSQISVPWQLDKVIKSFILDAEKYGVTDDRVFCLDEINIYKDNNESWGETEQWVKKGVLHGRINIRESILDDSVGLKWVVYHELGHWYGLEHSEEAGIMMDGYGKEISEWVTPYKFDVLTWKLFNKIREVNGQEKVIYQGIEEN